MNRTPLYHDFANGAIEEQSDTDLMDSFQPKQADVLATSDATVTTLATIELPADARGVLLVTLVGNTADGAAGLIGGKAIHWKCASGVAAVVASVVTVTDNLETLTTATWAVDASGGSLRIRVTGEAATNINWSAVWTIKYVETIPV